MKDNNGKKQAPARSLNAYSLAGIGIGGVIGAGFFLGSSIAVSKAGPSIIIAFLLGGIIMSQVLGAMTSISINRPVLGSFRVYTQEFLGAYMGFALGWIVFVAGILTISSEALAAGIFLKYWFPHVHVAIFALIVLTLVILTNAFGTRSFGYVESGMAAIKIAVLIIFIILGVIFLISKGSAVSPQPFSSVSAFLPKGINGLLQSMLIVIFTYGGVSAVAMAASEAQNPHKVIPRATVIVTLGIIILYVASMAVIVSTVRWDTINIKLSPFVQAFSEMHISFASTAMNLVIFIAALSVMIATYYSCTQMLISLAEAKDAPALIGRSLKSGFFRNAWIIVAAATLVVVAASFILGDKLFGYLVSASSYFSFFNWVVNLLTYLTWLRRRSSSEIYTSPLIKGRTGAYITLAAIAVLFFASLGVTDFRVGFYVAFVVFVVISIAYRLVKH